MAFAAITLGGIIGSFLTMASYRLPMGESWNGRSRCKNCQQTIKARHLIPIASWLLARGKSGCCGQRISGRYPAIEILTIISFLIIFFTNGLIINAAFLILLACLLILIVVIDFENQIILDSLNIALAISGLAYAFWHGDTVLYNLLAGIVLGSIAYLSAIFMDKWLGRESLGGGDIKFLAAAGIWTGLSVLPWLLILGGMIGIILGLIWQKIKKSAVFPFGPALCAALFILVIWRDWFAALLS